MKKALVIFTTILLVACAAYQPLVPTQADADRAGIALNDLEQGRALFEKKCHKCHSLKRPFKHSVDELDAAVPRMARKAHLSKEQGEMVLHYLVTMQGAKS